MIRAFLTDLDGTLSQFELLSEICSITGKRQESIELNEEFMASGQGTLAARIKLIEGVTIQQITQQLQSCNYLRPGAKGLFTYLKENNILTILNSGNILPIVKYYQKLLGIDHIVCTSVNIENGIIGPMFKKVDKYSECTKILNTHNISWNHVIALGDSLGDLEVLEHAKFSIAIDPKNGIEDHVDLVITEDSLQGVKSIITDLLN